VNAGRTDLGVSVSGPLRFDSIHAMEPIDPDATDTFTQAFPLAGKSYQRIVAAIQRGTLPNRRVGRGYRIADCDLLAWRERIHTDGVSPSTDRVAPGCGWRW
jgi:hypothetical protein